MTTTTDAPQTAGRNQPPALPQTRGARSLRTVGAVLAAVVVLLGAWGAVGSLADVWGGRESATASATYDARPTVELDVTGSVRLTTGGDQVVVERTWRAPVGHVRYAVDQQADRLVVHHTCPWYASGGCHADVAVTVPAGTAVEVHSADGTLAVHDLTGALTARVGNGHASVAGVTGDVDVRTDDGHVDVRDVQGSVVARSSDGGVLVSGVTGDVIAHSNDGRVDVSAASGDVEATSSSGDVTVRGTGEPVALEISTSAGHQTIQGATDPAATRTVRIHSSDGDVAFLGPRG